MCGSDTLTWSTSAGQTINVNDAKFISLEKFIGGSGNDAFNWSADYTATIDGGGGSDTLTWSTSAGQTINVNDAKFISLEKFIGGSGMTRSTGAELAQLH